METETAKPATPLPPAESKPSPANTTTSVDRDALAERANSGDPVAAIELVRLGNAEAATETPLGIAGLRLQAPKRLLYPKVPRSLSRVDTGLCDLFGQLAAGEAPWPLLVWGGVGGGKTFAGLAFADMVRRSVFLTLEDACSAVMKGEQPWVSKRETLAYRDETPPLDDTPIREPGDLLILDEIGERSKAGDLLYTTLKGILDYREFNHRRVGMYISNLSPAELALLFDDRIVSRLTAGSVVKLVGDDRRQGSP